MADSSWLEVELDAPATARPGTRARFEVRVRNAGDRSVDLDLHGRIPTLHVVVSDARGVVVWDSLAGQVMPATLLLHPLARGETLAVATRWDIPRDASPAQYLVRARLWSDDAALEAPPTTLEIL